MKKSNTKKYKAWRIRVDYKNGLKEWSNIVRNRDGNKCVICSSDQHTQAHHILDKKYYKHLSLEPNVGITLCVRCHKWDKYAAHTNPIWFVKWLMDNRPEQYMWCLEKHNIEPVNPVINETPTNQDTSKGSQES